MSEQLVELFEAEVEKRVNEKITAFAKQIAESYKLPISLLLRDASVITPDIEPDKKSGETSCLGVKANGQRCKFKAREGGYCNHHQNQRKKLSPIKVLSSSSLSTIATSMAGSSSRRLPSRSLSLMPAKSFPKKRIRS